MLNTIVSNRHCYYYLRCNNDVLFHMLVNLGKNDCVVALDLCMNTVMSNRYCCYC